MIVVRSYTHTKLSALLGPVFLASAVLSVYAIGVHRLSSYVPVLKQQLSEFSLTRAECFCCASSHMDPHTNQALPCDRELVYSKLHTWHVLRCGGSYEEIHGESRDATRVGALCEFDNYVQTAFAAEVLRRACASRLPYKMILYACVPQLGSAWDWLSLLGSAVPSHVVLMQFLEEVVYAVAIFPATIQLTLHVVTKLDKHNKQVHQYIWARPCVLWLIILLMAVALRAPIALFDVLLDTWAPTLFYLILAVPATAVLFQHPMFLTPEA